ncbi:hypothetical protein ACFPM0_16405 [Pseudonocardia sulfidoxydans]|uniref:hypothetical protein n=1 Tax=Pseudonocardia sulfidoxydans TaxID=54011 RepID=UPI003618001D
MPGRGGARNRLSAPTACGNGTTAGRWREVPFLQNGCLQNSRCDTARRGVSGTGPQFSAGRPMRSSSCG